MATTPKFFKVILDPLADTLRIPGEFMKRYGQNLQNRVLLKVPSETTSQVEIIRSDGQTLLQKGWKEFQERYSISFGYFLVFEYNGNSQFDVLIFDTTATEITYPVNNAHDFEVEESDDDSVVLLRQFSASNKGTKKAFSGNYLMKKSTNSGYLIPIFCLILVTMFGTMDKTMYILICAERSKEQRAVAKETSISFEKATSFADAHLLRNSFFISLMQPSYVSYRFILNISSTFVKVNMHERSTNVCIRLRNGKSWNVKYVGKNGRANVTSGWKNFVKDTGLKVGDACIFQVAKTTNLVWNAFIFRTQPCAS